MVMSFTYGKTTLTSYTDPEIVTVNKCIRRFGRAMPGAYLVDTYPILLSPDGTRIMSGSSNTTIRL
jgi:hypothetical protein